MKNSNAFSHLTLEECRIILAGIVNGSTKAAISQTIGKDKSTVGKEIKLHRKLTHKCSLPLECVNSSTNAPDADIARLTALSTALSAVPARPFPWGMQ